MTEAPDRPLQVASPPGGTTMPAGGGGFGLFAQLTRALRHAESVAALRFSIVNETRRLVPYRQAALLEETVAGRPRVTALSGIPVVERQAPLVRWLERLAAGVLRADPAAGLVHPLQPAASGEIGSGLAEGQESFGTGHALWCPLVAPGGRRLGMLWLDRAEPWRDAEALLLQELADSQSHALMALTGGRRPRRRWRGPLLWLALAGLAVAVLAIPVRRAALAPAEIVAQDLEVVAAPADGVIRSFQVAPNAPVSAGDLLFSLDDTDRRARMEVAEKALDIARVEHRQASQGALGGRRNGPNLAALKAQIDLKEVELEAARHELDRTNARAGRSGIVLLQDPQDWLGRPVSTGERVMLIAEPSAVRARAWLPVRDVLPLAPGAAVRLFLDLDPLTPLDGSLLRAGHEAEERPDGTLAYRLTIALDLAGGTPPPRIGLQGTARVAGDPVPLFLYLFHRPIAALRQATGI